MKIIFVTGKGGVGKSAVAAALAIRESKKGIKTLLVELGDQSFYKDYFQLSTLEYKPTHFRKNLDISIWSGQECLREYALHLLKIQSLYKLFFENPISKALIGVAPALPELSIMGKITSGPPRNVGPKLPYDCIVIDAFATGHFMALLQAPHGMADAIAIGPMADQSRAMSAVLKNPSMCEYFVVSLPEELPVVESVELSDRILNEVGIQPKVLLNRFLPITDEVLAAPTENEKTPELADFKKYLQQVNFRQNEMKQKLESGLGHKIQTLPFILENESVKIVESLSQELENV